MSNNKQSSIDILCGKLAMKLGIPHAITFYIDHQQEIAEAKAMHKEEIKTSMSVAFLDGLRSSDEKYKAPHEDWEDYYIKAFDN